MKINLFLTFTVLLSMGFLEVVAQKDNLVRYQINVYVHTTSDVALSANTGNYKFGYKIERRLKNGNGVVMPDKNYIVGNNIVGWAAPGDDVWIHYQLVDARNKKIVKEDNFHYSDFSRELKLYFIPEMNYNLVDEGNYKYWKKNR